MDEFRVEHVSKIRYDLYTNDLCIDVYSQIEDFKIKMDLTMAFIECYKVLVDCLNDFGQFGGDTLNSEKPFSKYSKIFDECSLSTDDTISLKEFDPFLVEEEGATEKKNILYWIGIGPEESYDSSQYYP